MIIITFRFAHTRSGVNVEPTQKDDEENADDALQTVQNIQLQVNVYTLRLSQTRLFKQVTACWRLRLFTFKFV